MPYDKSKPYSCPCCGYWNEDMKYDYHKHKKSLSKGMSEDGKAHVAIAKETAEEFLGAKIIVQEEEE